MTPIRDSPHAASQQVFQGRAGFKNPFVPDQPAGKSTKQRPGTSQTTAPTTDRKTFPHYSEEEEGWRREEEEGWRRREEGGVRVRTRRGEEGVIGESHLIRDWKTRTNQSKQVKGQR